MRMMRCECAAGTEISIRHKQFGRNIGRGALVDFDEKVGGKVDAVKSAKGDIVQPERDRTVADLLRGREALFVPVAPVVPKQDNTAPTPAPVKK